MYYTMKKIHVLLCICLTLSDAVVSFDLAKVLFITSGQHCLAYNQHRSISHCLRNSVAHIWMSEHTNEHETTPAAYKLNESPKRYGPPMHTEADFFALKRRVGLLENLVSELCGAVVYSDDMSVLERNTALGIGRVYRDASFSESRPPAFARKRIEYVLQKYQVTPKNQPHIWVKETSLYSQIINPNSTNTTDIHNTTT